MPVVIKRSEGGGQQPAKGSGTAAKPAAAKSSKSGGKKQAQSGLAAMDDRSKLIGLGVIIVISLLIVALFTNGFGLFGGGSSATPAQPGVSKSNTGLGVDTAVPGGRSATGGDSTPGVGSATPRGADRRDNSPGGGDQGEGIN